MALFASLVRCWAMAIVVVAAVACASSPPAEKAEGPPPMDVRTVALAGVEGKKMEWQRSARWIRRSLTQSLRARRTFDAVLDPAPKHLPPESVLVRGEILHQETLTGLGALGIGFGESGIVAVFTIEDADGRARSRFEILADGDKEHLMPARAMAETVGRRAAQAVTGWVLEQRRRFAEQQEAASSDKNISAEARQ